MKSIPTLFMRDRDSRLLIDKVTKSINWVAESKGYATRKWDGIAILVEGGSIWRRAEWRPGSKLINGFIKCGEPDLRYPNATIPGWVPVQSDFLHNPKTTDEKYLSKAWQHYIQEMKHIQTIFWEQNKDKAPAFVNPYAPAEKEIELTIPDGTYEMCGPDIRGNHERLSYPVLFRHGNDKVKNAPRTYKGLLTFLETYEGEGIVWHYPVGSVINMAKIKRTDFGFLTRYVPPVIVATPEPKTEEVKEDVKQEAASG